MDFKNDKKLHHKFLLRNFQYYRNLSDTAREKYLKRLVKFIDYKNFYAEGDLDLTYEMIVSIAATAIQITFGLNKYLIKSISNIHIYPDLFITRYKNLARGQTVAMNSISISWKHFQEGYDKSMDNRNVGLHEMAHAIEFDFLYSDRYDNNYADFYDAWITLVDEHLEKFDPVEKSFLRKYAAKNEREFFAVCIEHFFETPEELEKLAPDIYKLLIAILNQNPKNYKNDYKLKAQTILDLSKLKNFRYRQWRLPITLTLSGFFAGPVLLGILLNKTIMSFNTLFYSVLVISFVTAIIQFRFYLKYINKAFIIYILYNIFGLAVPIMSLVLAINFFICISDNQSYFFKIHQYKTFSNPFSEDKELNRLELYFNEINTAKIVYINLDKNQHPRYKTLIVKTKTGLFGLKVIKSKEWMDTKKKQKNNRIYI